MLIGHELVFYYVILIIRNSQLNVHKLLSNRHIHEILLVLFYFLYPHPHPILLSFQVCITWMKRLEMIHYACMVFKILVTNTTNKRPLVVLNHLHKLLFLWEKFNFSYFLFKFVLFISFTFSSYSYLRSDTSWRFLYLFCR